MIAGMYTESDLIYFAGFLDGEGTFTVYKAESRGSAVYSALVSFASTDLAIIKWALETFEGNSYDPATVGNREQAYQWQLRQKPLIKALIPGLLPYLRIKRLQADLLLRYVVTFEEARRGVIVSPEDTEVREAYCLMFKELNARGRGSAARKEQALAFYKEVFCE